MASSSSILLEPPPLQPILQYTPQGQEVLEPEVTAERDRVRFTLAEGPLERDV